MEAINSLAPEHLEIVTENAEALAEQIRHAGGIFIGRYSSEPVGDYFAGTNHVLPTNSTARFASGLNVDDFVKNQVLFTIVKPGVTMHQNCTSSAYGRLRGTCSCSGITWMGEGIGR